MGFQGRLDPEAVQWLHRVHGGNGNGFSGFFQLLPHRECLLHDNAIAEDADVAPAPQIPEFAELPRINRFVG